MFNIWRSIYKTFTQGSDQQLGRSVDKHRHADRCSSQFDSEADYLINLLGQAGEERAGIQQLIVSCH